MAENKNQYFPSSTNAGYSKNDKESVTLQSEKELKRQSRIKLAIFIGVFIVFQIIVMTVFGLVVMKVKTPKVGLDSINVRSLNSVRAPSSFNTSFTTQIIVKNTNWGPYKLDAGTATFLYQGVIVGQVGIPESKVGMRSTKKIHVTVNLNSDALKNGSNLGNELASGFLTLSSQAKLTGKLELMLIMKKKRSATMDCTIAFDLSTKTVQKLQCK